LRPIISSLGKGIQAATLLVACTSYSVSAQAQSVDDCMSARRADASNICNSVLASGSRSVDVYWKLSSSQFQDGQQALANKTLDDALSLHPGNSRLLSLREIIAAATTEEALIIRSSKVNQSSLDKGAVKIACLTKSGAEAILACQQRLELTNQDGDRIRARLALLESQQPQPTVIATVQPTQPSVPTIAAAPEPTAAELALEARKRDYRALVAEVQTTLNGFGFNVGSPDGVSGGKTRSALTEFYTTIGAPATTTISANTLEDLTREKRNLANAEQLLKQSEQSIEQGNAQLAGQQLANARSASRLLNVPFRHEQAVRTAQNVVVPVIPATAPVVTLAQIPVQTQIVAPAVAQLPTIVRAPAVAQIPEAIQTQAVVQTTASISQQFSQLMGKINILQGQIRRQQADQVKQMDRIRNVL
jgi:hypothetical protein